MIKSVNRIMIILGIMLASTCGPLQAMNAGDAHKRYSWEEKQLGKKLHEAAMSGGLWGLEQVKILLNKGAPINYVNNETDSTALMVAAFNDNLDIVRLLIEKGAEVNYQDDSGSTALLDAAKSGNFEIIRLLIEKGAEVNHQDDFGNTVLTLAAVKSAAEGSTEIIHFLIEKGAEAIHANKNGNTALWNASRYKNSLETYKILVEAMLKLTKQQKDSVYALIASLEKTPSLQTNKDTRKLMAQKLTDEYKKENLAKTRAEIEKIQKGELRNQLLQLLEGK